MSEKVAVFLFAGPEAACRLVHSIIFARDVKAKGGEAQIVLEGAAPEWLLLLPDQGHKLHGLYRKAKEEGLIVAVCEACASQVGAVEAAVQEGLALVGDAFGHVSLVPFTEDGYRIVTL